MLRFLGIALCAASLCAQASTVDEIQQRDYLKCGVSQGLPGFSAPDDQGNWQGIDVDYCRAIASAVLGSKDKVQFIPLSAKERFTALQSGEIDVLSRNTSWTYVRDVSLGVDFVGTLYYDGQSFMVPNDIEIEQAKDLDGVVICTNAGTTTELNIADFFDSHGLEYEVLTFEKTDEAVEAYESNRCDTYSTDASALAAQRLSLANPGEHRILDKLISKEPLSPVVRQGDDQWTNIARWTLYVMINAEELGVDSSNVDEKLTSTDPNVARLLGRQGDLAELIGLDERWSYRVIKEVGNYGEVFEKNLGQETPIKIQRGLNALWSQGGLMYAPPVR